MASLPSFERFIVHGEETTAGTRWKKWIAKLENLLCGLDIANDARKKALLLHYAGDDVFEIFDSFSDEAKGVGAVNGNGAPNEYEVVKQSLTDYFTPNKTLRLRHLNLDKLHRSRVRTLMLSTHVSGQWQPSATSMTSTRKFLHRLCKGVPPPEFAGKH